MSHYYSEKQDDVKSDEKIIKYQFENHSFKFVTDHGVFSKDHVDRASDILLRSLKISDHVNRVLDLGCGYGVLGIVIAKIHDLTVTLSDVNERAINLAKRNVELNHVQADVMKSRSFDAIDNLFDLIVINPPIRIGKQALYDMFKQTNKHLTSKGECWMVMHKKHGALSALKYLQQIGHAKVVSKAKGFHVILFKKTLTT